MRKYLVGVSLHFLVLCALAAFVVNCAGPRYSGRLGGAVEFEDGPRSSPEREVDSAELEPLE